jgi:homoserine dehydrogenase
MKDTGKSKHKYFLRLNVEDRPGILAGVAGVLGNNNVSINQVIQKPAVNGVAELVVITDRVEKRFLHDALVIFGEMSMIRSVDSVIRVYTQK